MVVSVLMIAVGPLRLGEGPGQQLPDLPPHGRVHRPVDPELLAGVDDLAAWVPLDRRDAQPRQLGADEAEHRAHLHVVRRQGRGDDLLLLGKAHHQRALVTAADHQPLASGPTEQPAGDLDVDLGAGVVLRVDDPDARRRDGEVVDVPTALARPTPPVVQEQHPVAAALLQLGSHPPLPLRPTSERLRRGWLVGDREQEPAEPRVPLPHSAAPAPRPACRTHAAATRPDRSPRGVLRRLSLLRRSSLHRRLSLYRRLSEPVETSEATPRHGAHVTVRATLSQPASSPTASCARQTEQVSARRSRSRLLVEVVMCPPESERSPVPRV